MKNYIIEICLVGPNGSQAEYTCKWLNRTREGYSCKKLTGEACTNSLKGDHCKGQDFKDIVITNFPI